METSDLLAQLSVGFVLAALFAVQLPEGGTLLLVPALLLTYLQRSTFQIEPELKRIAALFILFILFFTIVSADLSRAAKGAYDIMRGLLVFFPAVWLGGQLTKACPGKSIAMVIGLFFVLANFALPGTYYGQEHYGFHDNPNNVAVTLTAYLFLLVALYPKPPGGSRWHLLALSIALCAALFLLASANSRGSWLGVAAAFSAIILLQPNIDRRIKLTLVCAVGGGLAALVALVDLKGFGYGTVGARIEIWKGLWALTVPTHVWLGYGVNNVKDVMMASGLPTLTAHNIFLEVFVSAGLIGLSAFVYIVYRLAAFLLSQSYARGPVLYAGIGGLTAFLVMGQFDLKFASFRFIGMISCFLGLIYSQRLRITTAEQSR